MENTTYILYKGEKINVETTTQQTTTQTTIQQTTTTTTQQGKGGNCKKNNASLTDVLVSITSSIALVGACAYLYKRK
jgi:hypothetical protein